MRTPCVTLIPYEREKLISWGRIQRRKVRNLWSVPLSKTTYCRDFHFPWDQMFTMNKSAILLVNDWWSQKNQHFLHLRIIPEYRKSPPRNPGLFGREHLVAKNSSLWIRPLEGWGGRSALSLPPIHGPMVPRLRHSDYVSCSSMSVGLFSGIIPRK